jgi:hypothetical protein
MALKIKNSFIIFCIAILTFSSCKQKNGDNRIETKPQTKNYVEVVTTGMDFDLVDKVPSGWTTFRYVNNSFETHFFILEKMPDSLGIETYKKELVPIFKSAFQYFDNGKMKAGMKEFEKIPSWFNKVEIGGGVGLTSPNSTTESTICLHPGTYVMECYVRTPDGMAHAFMGMLKELKVMDTPNNNSPPKADYMITLSSDKGISFLDSLKVGNYTLAVKFENQKKYENMLGHDVNLVKLDDNALIDTLGAWLNTSDVQAFRTPAPDGLTFLGGVEDLPEKNKGFFKVNLEKGNYVLISEIPKAVERKMFKVFKVY